MSLTQHLDLIQGSPEWFDQRRGIVTASEVGTIITPSTIKPAANMASRAYAALIAAERITGWTVETYVSPDMFRGSIEEPYAINAYTARTDGTATLAGLMVRDDWGFKVGYSPDALIDDDGLIEVKSRAPKKHLQTIIADEVPAENMAQLQCGLLVSGRAWIDYVSFCGGMPLYIKRVTPDPEWQAALVRAVDAFEDAVEDMTRTYYNRVGGLPLTERVAELEMRF